MLLSRLPTYGKEPKLPLHKSPRPKTDPVILSDPDLRDYHTSCRELTVKCIFKDDGRTLSCMAPLNLYISRPEHTVIGDSIVLDVLLCLRSGESWKIRDQNKVGLVPSPALYLLVRFLYEIL